MLHAASIFLNDRRAILRRLYFMTDVSCIYLIRKMYDTLSKTEKKIADFVLANPGRS